MKKTFAGIVFAIGIVGIGACVAISYYSWSLNPPIAKAIEGGLTVVEQFLSITSEGLDRISGELSEAQKTIDDIESTLLEATEIINESDLVFEVIETAVDDTLLPLIDETEKLASSILETVVTINHTLTAINEIPFIEIPTLTPQLKEVVEDMESIQQEVQETKNWLESVKQEKVAKPVNPIQEKTSRISSGFQEIQQLISGEQAHVKSGIDSVGMLKSKVPLMLNVISILVTAIMLWLSLAQASLMMRSFVALPRSS